MRGSRPAPTAAPSPPPPSPPPLPPAPPRVYSARTNRPGSQGPAHRPTGGPPPARPTGSGRPPSASMGGVCRARLAPSRSGPARRRLRCAPASPLSHLRAPAADRPLAPPHCALHTPAPAPLTLRANALTPSPALYSHLHMPRAAHQCSRTSDTLTHSCMRALAQTPLALFTCTLMYPLALCTHLHHAGTVLSLHAPEGAWSVHAHCTCLYTAYCTCRHHHRHLLSTYVPGCGRSVFLPVSPGQRKVSGPSDHCHPAASNFTVGNTPAQQPPLQCFA